MAVQSLLQDEGARKAIKNKIRFKSRKIKPGNHHNMSVPDVINLGSEKMQ